MTDIHKGVLSLSIIYLPHKSVLKWFSKVLVFLAGLRLAADLLYFFLLKAAPLFFGLPLLDPYDPIPFGMIISF